jgi:hypothetical protein
MKIAGAPRMDSSRQAACTCLVAAVKFLAAMTRNSVDRVTWRVWILETVMLWLCRTRGNVTRAALFPSPYYPYQILKKQTTSKIGQDQ